jgi:hypothetical protein
VLLVLGGLATCGVGSCLLLGLAALGASDDEPAATRTVSNTAPDESPSEQGKLKYACTATGWAMVCRMGGACTNMLVSGAGIGDDKLSASNMALTACRGSLVASGGTGGCSVACSPPD